jgi:hypothetical protein
MGIIPKNCVKNTDRPIKRKTIKPVTRCSLTPKNFAFSPGAAVSDSSLSAITWFIESTVAATNHGRPRTELIAIQSATSNKSR